MVPTKKDNLIDKVNYSSSDEHFVKDLLGLPLVVSSQVGPRSLNSLPCLVGRRVGR